MRAFIDPDTCLGCGVCESIAPKVFRLGVEPYAKVIADPVPQADEAKVREAEASCPEQAISIEEQN